MSHFVQVLRDGEVIFSIKTRDSRGQFYEQGTIGIWQYHRDTARRTMGGDTVRIALVRDNGDTTITGVRAL